MISYFMQTMLYHGVGLLTFLQVINLGISEEYEQVQVYYIPLQIGR